jgi:hypothetical protein
MRKYLRFAESWTILQETGVFDSVMRTAIATIEESLWKKRSTGTLLTKQTLISKID